MLRWWRRGLTEPTPAEPTAPPPAEHSLAGTLARNIEAVAKRRAEERASASGDLKFALRLGGLIGRMGFVYAHVVLYGAWLLVHRGVIPGAAGFDPSLTLMGTVASVEGILLSTLILITQNHSSAQGDRRDDLNLQVSLLAEHEVTQLIKLNLAIAAKLGIEPEDSSVIADLQRDVALEAVLDHIEGAENEIPAA